jgi:hypothetical protein
MKEKIIAITDLELTINERERMAGYKIITSNQEILLMIDNSASCCESWGWFWCNDNPRSFIGTEIKDIRLTNEALNQVYMSRNDLDPSEKYFDGGICYVNIETNRGILQFVAYNLHNGYYGHTAKIVSKQLNHEEVL